MIYGIVGLGLMGASYAKRLTDLHETVYGFAVGKNRFNMHWNII